MQTTTQASCRLWAMLMALLFALPLNLLAAPAAEAITIDPMTSPKWTNEVNGDFIQVGNGVLACDPNSLGPRIA